MSATMTAILDTQFNSAGLDQAKTGFAGLNETINTSTKVGQTFSMNFDSLGKRMERPLSRMAFAGIAESIISASGAMSGASKATVMLQEGLHVVGVAALALPGPWALISIGLAAAITLFEKLSTAMKVNSDTIKQNADALITERDSLLKNIEANKEFGKLNAESKARIMERLAVVKEAIKADGQSIGLLNDNITARGKEIEALQKSTKAYEDSFAAKAKAQGLSAHEAMMTSEQNSQWEREKANRALISTLIEKQSDDQMRLNGLLASGVVNNTQAAASQKTYSLAVADSYKTLKDLMDLRMNMDKEGASGEQKAAIDQQIKSWNDLGFTVQNASSAIIKNQLAVAQMEIQLSKTTDEEKKKQIQSEIQWYNATVQAEQGVVQAQAQAQQQMATQFQSYIKTFATAFNQSNGDFLKAGKAVAAQFIQTEADKFAGQLALQAAADIGTGNFAGAAIALAAATAIETAGGALAASFGGGASSVGTPSVSTAAPVGSGQSTNVVVNFQGGNLGDPGAVAVIMKGITQQVVQNNGQVVTTQVVGNGTAPPGVLA